ARGAYPLILPGTRSENAGREDSQPARGAARLFEIGHRIDRARALAHFEMKLRPVRVARHARKRDLLTAPDGIAALHLHLGSVPVDRHEAVLMPNENRVAETFQPVPR